VAGGALRLGHLDVPGRHVLDIRVAMGAIDLVFRDVPLMQESRVIEFRET
jgi:hypothetical protein